MGDIPLLYQKLLKGLEEYSDVKGHPLNREYEARRNALGRQIAATFRIRKEDIPKLFAELESMGKLTRQNQRKIRLR